MAKITGCSYQTVSRVVNDDARISEETRERVLTAIEAVGCRCSAATCALVTSRPGTIGVVSDGPWRYGPMGALHGVEEAICNIDHSVFFAVRERDAFKSLEATLHRLADVSVDGIVVIAPLRAGAETTREVVTSFSWTSGLPMVMLTPDSRPTPGIRVVTEGQRFRTRLATRHLVRLGHRHIAHLVGD